MKIDFTIPIYNEDRIFIENANRVLNFLKNAKFTFDWSLVFVINGSSETLERKVREYVLHHDNVSELAIKEKGKGNAIKKYFNISSADILVYMDMDLAVSLDNINDLIYPLISKQADLCFGSRMLPQSSRKRSWFREFNSRLYIFLSQIILDHDFSDLQCGFKAITKKTWNKIGPRIQNNFWFFDTELIYYAKKNKCKIMEIPIDWSENRYDNRQSKVKVWKDGFAFIFKLIDLKMRK